MSQKRVVVVGGTGNISGAVVDALTAEGHDVTVFVRGLRDRPLPAGVRVLTGDRSNRAAFEQTMQEEEFDAAYDLICYTPEDAESDLRAFDGIGHFVHTSTVATIGGELAQLPANEETDLRPALMYGKAKARADELFLNAHRELGFPVTILKPTHTWGVGMAPLRQLGFDPHWIKRLQAGRPLLIGGNGMTRWSLCHSEDTAKAYVGLLLQPSSFGETYIVADPEPITWIEYHQEIAKALGVELHLVHAPIDPVLQAWPEITELLSGMSRWDHWYDVSKIQEAVPSFEPKLKLRDRIAENVEWAERSASPPGVPDREEEVLRELEPLLTE